jgi:hypothetical protein
MSTSVVIEKDRPKMKTYSWQNKFIDTNIYFQMIYMEPDVCWIWIGSQPTFNSLSISMNTKYGKVPLVTDIFGNYSEDNVGRQFAQRLAMKFKKKENVPNSRDVVFYVSCNLNSNDNEIRAFVERNTVEKLKEFLF